MFKTKMLKKNYEFKSVLSRGKYYSGNFIDIVLLRNNKDKNLLGIAISTKVGKATQRNRVKRLIRENYKTIEERIISGQTIVFLCKKNIEISKISYKDIEEDIKNIFNKAGLINYNEKNIN